MDTEVEDRYPVSTFQASGIEPVQFGSLSLLGGIHLFGLW